jgi:hypothetical protein
MRPLLRRRFSAASAPASAAAAASLRERALLSLSAHCVDYRALRGRAAAASAAVAARAAPGDVDAVLRLSAARTAAQKEVDALRGARRAAASAAGAGASAAAAAAKAQLLAAESALHGASVALAEVRRRRRRAAPCRVLRRSPPPARARAFATPLCLRSLFRAGGAAPASRHAPARARGRRVGGGGHRHARRAARL